MADDSGVTARLAVALEARVSDFERQLDKAVNGTDRSMSAIERRAAQMKAKLESSLEKIDLEHKLDVARASGNSKMVAQLNEELAVRSRMLVLEKAGLETSKAKALAEAQVAAVAHAAERHAARKEGVPGAIEDVFSRARLGVFEEGGAKIGLFGGALEKLGASGLVAAAGLFAAGEALEQAHKAMEWSSEIEKFAKTVGASAEDVQVFDDANIKSAVGLQQGRAGLEEFTGVFAKFQAHLGDKKSAKWFDAIGLSREDAKNTTDSMKALEETLTKIAAMPNPSNRLGAANALGLEAFKPVLAEGEEGVKKFIAAMEDARANGGIVSDEDIEKAAELNEHVEVMQHRIGQELKGAFLALAPGVDAVATFLYRVASAVKAITDQIPAAIAGFKSYVEKLEKVLGLQGYVQAYQKVEGWEQKNIAAPVHRALEGLDRGARLPDGSYSGNPMVHAGKYILNRDIANLSDGGMVGDAWRALVGQGHKADPSTAPKTEPKGEGKKGGGIPPPATQFGEDKEKKEPKGPKDRTEEIAKASAAAIDAAEKEELTARLALVTTLEDQHAIRLDLLKSEREAKNTQLAEQVKLKQITAAAGAKATALNNQAFDEKIALENRNYQLAMLDQARAYADDMRRFQVAHLQHQADIANTAEEWARDTRAAFVASQATEMADFEAGINKRMRTASADHLTAEEGAAEIAAERRKQAEDAATKDKEVDAEIQRRKMAFAAQLDGYLTASLQSEATLARTAAERLRIEREILDIRQKQARDELETSIKTDKNTPEQAAQRRSGLAGQQAGENRVFDQEHLDPWEKWKDDGAKAAADVATALAEAKVHGMDAFNQSLFDSEGRFRSLQDIAHSVLMSLTKDAEQFALKWAEAQVFGGGSSGAGGLFGGLFGGGKPAASSASGGGGIDIDSMLGTIAGLALPGLPHFASGGVVGGEGGPTSDNVLAALSPGEVVLSNSTLSALRGVQGIDPSKMAGGSSTVVQQFHLHAEGAVMTPDLINGLNAQADALARFHANRMGAQTLAAANRAAPGRMASYQALGS